MEKDPICGMLVDPETTKFKVEQNGGSYYFCSERCEIAFEKRLKEKPKNSNFFTRFLERLARANAEKFGNTPPSCCGGSKQ